MYFKKYDFNEGDIEKVAATFFNTTDEGMTLKVFPSKEKKKILVLLKIASLFENDRTYSEKEVNGILKPIYGDYVLLRRSLIDYQIFSRSKNCETYELNDLKG